MYIANITNTDIGRCEIKQTHFASQENLEGTTSIYYAPGP